MLGLLDAISGVSFDFTMTWLGVLARVLPIPW